MFDSGSLEMLLIVVIALIVIGPERLPKVARTIGHFVGKARAFVATTRSDIEREFQASEMRDLLDKQSREIDALREIVTDKSHNIHDEISKAAENLVDPTPFKPEPATPEDNTILPDKKAETKTTTPPHSIKQDSQSQDSKDKRSNHD